MFERHNQLRNNQAIKMLLLFGCLFGHYFCPGRQAQSHIASNEGEMINIRGKDLQD